MTEELRTRLQNSLGAAYTIERELGGGGMSFVFVAEEAALGRKVAVKVLRSDVSAEISIERFKREILVAARLQHPHIVPVLTAGEIGGFPYYTMPFVDGESLETRLQRDGALPVRDAARLLAGIARALAYAHRCGVVHRDIKPGNVLIVDGTPMVTDFGIAKAIVTARGTHPASTDGRHADQLTALGETIGTPAYMAPEQITGDPGVDHRVDIYSFGVLAYEMFAGKRPFPSASYQVLAVSHLTKDPPPLGDARPELPPELVALVARCLRKLPEDRPASADELLPTLDAFAGGETTPAMLAAIALQAEVLASSRLPVFAAPAPAPPPPRPPVIARETEEAELEASLDISAKERGILHAVVGEAGLGKTTLVENFLIIATERDARCRVGSGRCSERLAGTEAYLPFLEALENLLAGPGGATVASTMRVVAPAWYAQVNPSTGSNPSGTRTPDARAGSSEQMKRQLSSLLQELSRSGPLVLFLEDVHWADASTVDLISYLGDRFDTLRVLLLVTYRPSDLLLARHPFVEAKLKLESHDSVRETAVRQFDREGLDAYLNSAYPHHEFPKEFVSLLLTRTEGTPLFVVDLMRQLANRGVITHNDDVWRLDQSVESVASELPQSIRSVIQRTIDRLDDADRRLLVAASVQGAEFDSALLARAIEMDNEEVEERLERLERVHAMVRLVEERVLAKRHPSLRYAFTHILYQNTLHATLRATRRMTLSAAVASAMQEYFGDDPAHALQLGVLYEAAREFERAAACFLTATRTATRLFASKEAVLLAQRGLAALESLPDTLERARIELQLQIALGVPLTEWRGYAAAEVEQVYSRARDLCARFSDTPTQLPVLHGLYRFYIVRGQLHAARDVVQQLIGVALQTGDPKQIFIARAAMGPTLVHLGEFEGAVEHLETGMAAYEPSSRGSDRLAVGAFMPGAWLALARWMLGQPNEALAASQAAREFAERQQNPLATAYWEAMTAWLHQLGGDAALVNHHADAAFEISRTHDFAQWRAVGSMLRAWAIAVLGDPAAGVTQLTRAIEAYRRTGAELNLPHFYSLLAESHLLAGDVAAGLEAVREALAFAAKNDDRSWEPELHRLKGELLIRFADETKGHTEPGTREAARAAFHVALDVAQRQKSRSLELRAGTTLARVYMEENRHERAKALLTRVIGHFPIELRTRELDAARALL